MEEVHPAQSVDAIIKHALHALTQVPAVGRAGIALDEGAGRRLLFTASDRGGPAIDWCHIDAFDDVPLTSVARSGRPVDGTLADLAGRFPEFVARQADTATTALIAAPLTFEGTLLGGVVAFVHDVVPLAALRADVSAIAAATAAQLDALRRSATRPPRRRSDPSDDTLHRGRTFAVAGARDVSPARRRLRQLLTERGIEAETVEDAVICLSELLANAVMHAGASADVHVEITDALLRVTVGDQGSYLGTGPQPVRGLEPTAVHGRGLQILAALSTRWGSEARATGTEVWFELALREPGVTPTRDRPRVQEQLPGPRRAQDRVSIPDQDRR